MKIYVFLARALWLTIEGDDAFCEYEVYERFHAASLDSFLIVDSPK